MTYTFIIPNRLPGLNDMINAERANKYKGAQLKKSTQKMLKAVIHGQLGNLRIKKQVKMNYTWVERNKRRDKDNITAGRKYIQDALVELGILENDGWDNIQSFADTFEVNSSAPCVRVEIIEVEDEGSN